MAPTGIRAPGPGAVARSGPAHDLTAQRVVDRDHRRVGPVVPGGHHRGPRRHPGQLAHVGQLDHRGEAVPAVLGQDEGVPLVGALGGAVGDGDLAEGHHPPARPVPGAGHQEPPVHGLDQLLELANPGHVPGLLALVESADRCIGGHGGPEARPVVGMRRRPRADEGEHLVAPGVGPGGGLEGLEARRVRGDRQVSLDLDRHLLVAVGPGEAGAGRRHWSPGALFVPAGHHAAARRPGPAPRSRAKGPAPHRGAGRRDGRRSRR